jgi:hypothetical protein
MEIWTPGAAGPLDEFVQRTRRMVDAFAQEHKLDRVELRVELADGSRHLLERIEPEPGFGFLSCVPVREEGEEARRLVVPIGAVKIIELSAPDPARSFGFNTAA